MTSENKGQPIEIPKATRRLSFSNPRSWWFDRGSHAMTNDERSTMSSSAPSGHNQMNVGSMPTTPPPLSSSPPAQADIKGHRASLPAPSISDWYPSRWRRSSLKFDDDDLMMSMRIPPM